jgi:hypothetical protein
MDIRKQPITAADVDMLRQMIWAASGAADPDADSQLEAVHTVFVLIEQL